LARDADPRPPDEIADLLALLRREPVLNTIALGLLKEAAEPAQRSNWLSPRSNARGGVSWPRRIATSRKWAWLLRATSCGRCDPSQL